jgi:hypothetical protein
MQAMTPIRRITRPRQSSRAAAGRPRWLLLVVFWAIPSLAQDIHNGPVAIRPMVTAPQLMGKTPSIRKINHCPEERAQLKETWHNAESEMANGDDVVHGHTRAQLKERYIYGDKIIATLGASIHSVGMDCDDALSLATDALFGD